MKHGSHEHHQKKVKDQNVAKGYLRRFWIVTFLLVPLFLLSEKVLSFLSLSDFFLRRHLQFTAATAIFYFSLIFFQHARHEIKMKKYGMMTLVSLAVGAGYLFSAASAFIPVLEGVEFYLEISTLIWILLFGHYLEAKSSSAAGNALQEVAKLLPKQAHLVISGKVVEKDIADLKEGDLVLVKPGEKVPADGVIIKGKASMDESLISGESKPVAKRTDDKVVAGSICLDGSLEVRLERVGESSTIGQIQQLIAKAQMTKPEVQKVADKAAGVLTITALVVALLTVLVWSLVIGKSLVFALTLAITVLVIACPHALGLAIPTVSTIATSLAVKNGVFLKDLGKLEVVKDVDWVVFDKTGTLTKGEFGVTDVVNLGLKDKNEVLSLASALERSSSHVIGLAIVKFAESKGIESARASGFKNLAGKGSLSQLKGRTYFIGNKRLMKEKSAFQKQAESEAQKLASGGKTVVFLADKNQVLGILALSDSVKDESQKAVERLHQQGIKVAMLTGDNQKAAQFVAKELGIDDFFAEVLPEDKYKHIKKLQEQGSKVMMVGDGVNDAPALTQADVGVAVGAGTDVAVESGDIVLTRNNPEDIVRLISLGKKVYRKMVENLVWATGYNVIAIPAAAGVFAAWGFFLRPEIGAILMSLSSVIVVVNAMRLKKAVL
ncbi:MAG TPA: heavy metal translocating P-type ATPase [Candidatus Bathyarchaeia archaeon]|nr:heavy metal translocating P-type ATPase [Candidatus Bathyarchaeia archaeon]